MCPLRRAFCASPSNPLALESITVSATRSRRQDVREDSLHISDAELSRHLLQAQEEERKRISRELHDETGQGLMVLRLYLGMLAKETSLGRAKIEEAVSMLDRTIADLRRIIARLSPR